MKKNLVMGAAKGYDWDNLEPFVNSWKKNCPNAELVLFVDDISDFTRDKLIREGVFLEEFPAEMKTGVPNNTRWKIFADFLEIHGDNYEQIFITDTRDVIFQGDVFEKFKGYSNYLCCATEIDDIGGSKTNFGVNYTWIGDCYGKTEADKLLNKKIICDGTIIGTADEVKIFAQKMWRAVFAVEKRVDFRIHDQAVANYLIYNNLIPIENLIESDTDSGEIFTAGLIGILHPIEIRGGKILRGDGGIPAVVHQYDRHKYSIRLVNEIYRDKNFQLDGRFDDTRSAVEQTISLLHADKIAEASRLFLRKFLSDTDLNNFYKSLIRIWFIALKKPLSQPLELLELAIQNVLKSHGVSSDFPMRTVRDMICCAERTGHPVDFEFKCRLANTILESAKRNLDLNRTEICLSEIELINSFNMPPDKNFYLFVAKANRLAGRKDAALAAYKKVLELG